MSIMNQGEYNCPTCETALRIDVYSSINVDRDPELKASVLNGKINSALCSGCGKKIVINQPILYHDMTNNYVIFYIPEHVDPHEHIKASEIFPFFGDYTMRYVTRLPELVEKINIFDHRLNDIAIQLIKMNFFNNETFNIDGSIQDIFFIGQRENLMGFRVINNNDKFQTVTIEREHYTPIFDSLKQLDILNPDSDQCIYVTNDYLLKLLRPYM
ncbi:MAG: CpXC domain-containing protein [Syntrophomonadaceae bacterium]